MKSPAWILVPSIIILLYLQLVILPGVGDTTLPSLYVHKVTLSPKAQEAVAFQTGKTAATAYTIHPLSYCEFYYETPYDTRSTLNFKCFNSPSLSFFFNFETILGLPDEILNDRSPSHNELVTKFNSSLLQFKKISLLYTYLALLLVFSRFSVVSIMVPLRLVQLRLPYSRSTSLQNKFMMLRGLFTLFYIIAFVSTNLISAVAVLHYRFYFYKGMYDLGDNTGVEDTLSTTVIAFHCVILFLTYVELYPALTYMCQRPPLSKGVYRDPTEDPEAFTMGQIENSSNLHSTTTTLLSESIINSEQNGKTKTNTSFNHNQVSSSYVGTSTCVNSDSSSINSLDSFNSLSSLSPSSIISDPPSLQASSLTANSEATPSIISEVSTTNQYGESSTPTASAAPSIRSLSTMADQLMGYR